MADRPVQLFVTCLVDHIAPEVGKAAVAVLTNVGCDVGFPQGQTCCGQPAFNVGLVDDARVMAIHTIGVLKESEGTVVVPSGSCAAMIVKHYPDLLAGTPHEHAALQVAERTRELSQFLVDDLGVVEVDTACDGCSITVHRSCHGLRNLGLTDQVDRLMNSVRGTRMVGLDGAEECCGFGGLFSVEMPEVSAAVMDTKLDRVEASGADYVVGGDISCLLHMEGGLRRRNSAVAARHFVEILAGEDRSGHQ